MLDLLGGGERGSLHPGRCHLCMKSLELDHGAVGARGALSQFPVCTELCWLWSWAGLSLLPQSGLFIAQEERIWLCPAGFQQPWALLSPAAIE